MILINILSFLGTTCLAVSFLVIGMPLYYGKVKPNIIFGYYLSREGLTNNQIWYEVNKMGGTHLIVLGFFLSLNSIISAIFLNITPAQIVILKITIFISLLGIFYSLLRTYIFTMNLTDLASGKVVYKPFIKLFSKPEPQSKKKPAPKPKRKPAKKKKK